MQIKVRSLQGDEYVLQVENDQLVSRLKTNISELASELPVDRQKLVYKGRTMQDSSLIGEYNLEEDCKVHLIVQRAALSTSNHPDNTTACPMDITQQAESSCDRSEQQPKIDDNHDKQTNKPPQSRFETILRERLSRLYNPAQIELIMAHISREIDQDISCSSLDDLERLAKQKLNITDD